MSMEKKARYSCYSKSFIGLLHGNISEHVLKKMIATLQKIRFMTEMWRAINFTTGWTYGDSNLKKYRPN